MPAFQQISAQAQAGPAPATHPPVTPFEGGHPPPPQLPAPDDLVPDLPSTIDLEAEIAGAITHAGAQFQGPFPFESMPHFPPELLGLVLGSLGLLLAMIVGFPIARALARRIDRQGEQMPPVALPPAEVLARLERIEHAVETMAVEIERISEGQRFTTRLFSEHLRELGSGSGVPTGRPPQ